jgi:CRP-like cAMP-binding protein
MNGSGIDVGIVRQLPLFEGLGDLALNGIARAGRLIHCRKSELLVSRGESLDGLYIVCEGDLKLYMLSCNGQERILRVLKPGDSFGEALMFDGYPSPVFVETLSPSVLAFFPREIMANALHAIPTFSAKLFRSMGGLISELLRDIEACCLMNARQRTIAYLLREAETDIDPDMPRVTLPASKMIVASMLNLSAETFSRELHQLREKGLIEISRRTIVLRQHATLVQMANGVDDATRE